MTLIFADGENTMADISSSRSTPENLSEYEAVADQLLADMRALEAQMQRDRIEIDQLKAKTKLLKAETVRLEADNRAALNRLKAAL
jgi:cytochrome c556